MRLGTNFTSALNGHFVRWCKFISNDCVINDPLRNLGSCKKVRRIKIGDLLSFHGFFGPAPCSSGSGRGDFYSHRGIEQKLPSKELVCLYAQTF